jgi:hypothetical protein
VVLFEGNSRILRETFWIRTEGLQKILNLSADLRVLGPPPLSRLYIMSL